MKFRQITFIVISLAVLASCGNPSGENQIQKLEAEKARLQEKIQKIDKKIAELQSGETDSVNVKEIAVITEPVQSGHFTDYIKVQGDVTSDNNIQVPAEYNGIIRKIHVEEGSRVNKGDLLAVIDSEVLNKQKAELETSLELARTTYERQKRLWDKKIGSEMQFLQAKNQKESLEKKLETLNEQLKSTRITAPISGSIDKVFIKKGEIIQMGLPAFRIVQLSNLKIEAELSEKYVDQVSKGDSVKVQFPATGKAFTSEVDAVSQVIDPDNRTFTVEVNIPRDIKVKPNMIGEMKIINYVSDSSLTVPMNIIQKNEKGRFVFVAKEQDGGWIAERRVVEVNRYNTTHAEISSGIKEGEQLIVDGYQNISDTQPVRIVESF